MKDTRSAVAGMAVLVGALAVIIIAGFPLLVVWALNTLFPVLAIPYTFSTWAAALIVISVLHSAVGSGKKGK